jgi:hypothetical protein
MLKSAENRLQYNHTSVVHNSEATTHSDDGGPGALSKSTPLSRLPELSKDSLRTLHRGGPAAATSTSSAEVVEHVKVYRDGSSMREPAVQFWGISDDRGRVLVTNGTPMVMCTSERRDHSNQRLASGSERRNLRCRETDPRRWPSTTGCGKNMAWPVARSSCAVGILTMVWSELVRVRARTVPSCTSASSTERRPRSRLMVSDLINPKRSISWL